MNPTLTSKPTLYGNSSIGYSTNPNYAQNTAQTSNNGSYLSANTQSTVPDYTPSIAANQLGSTAPTYQAPGPQVPTAGVQLQATTDQNHFQIGQQYGLNQYQYDPTQQSGAQQAYGQNQDVISQRLNQINQQLQTQPGYVNDLNNQYGIYGQQTAVAQATNAYQARQLALSNAQGSMLSNAGGATSDSINNQYNDITRQGQQDLATLGIVQSAATNNLAAAQAIIKQKADLAYEPLQLALNTYKDAYSMNKDMLDRADSQRSAQVSASLSDRQTQIDYLKSQKTLAGQIALQAAQNPNTPQSVIQDIANADNAQDAIKAAGNYLATPKYQALPFGATNLFNPYTGQVIGSDGTGSGGTSSGSSAVNNVTKNLGFADTTPATAVDPNKLFSALVQNEGSSPKGVINNPTNIKYVGQPGAIDSGITASDGGTFASYPTADAGKQAAIQNIQHLQGKYSTLGDLVAAWTGQTSAYASSKGQTSTDTTTSNTPSTSIVNSAATNPTFDQNPVYQSLTPALKTTVASLLNYTADPGSITQTNGYNQKILNTVRQIDPNFDEGKYKQIQTLKTAYQTGTESDQITAANTAIKHIAELKDAFSGLNNGNTKFVNSISNIFKGQKGNAALDTVEQSANLVADELSKLYSGTGGATESAITNISKSITSDMTPAEQKAVIDNAIKLVYGKTDTLSDKYQQTTGQSYPIFSDNTQKILSSYGFGPDGQVPPSNNAASSTSPFSITAPNGKQYTFSSKQGLDQFKTAANIK